MWIKLLICCCVVAFCTFLGYFAAGKYRSRKKFFAQFSSFNENYLNELQYARRPLSEFLKDAPGGEFGKAAEGRSGEAFRSQSFLTEDEKKLCTEYFSMLGKGDSLSQKSYFSARRPQLEALKSESEKEAKTKGELYLKLGLLAGLAFVILII